MVLNAFEFDTTPVLAAACISLYNMVGDRNVSLYLNVSFAWFCIKGILINKIFILRFRRSICAV